MADITKLINELTWYNLIEKLKTILSGLSTRGREILNTNDSIYPIIPTKTEYMLTYTGTTTTSKLPPVSDYEGTFLFLINAGSGNVTITSNDGSNNIWEGGINESSAIVPNGTIVRILNDGIKWRIV